MSERIRKVYAIGGQTFDTYAEAVAVRKSLNASSIRDLVTRSLDDVCWEGWTGDQDEILDVLFRDFDIKPKRTPRVEP